MATFAGMTARVQEIVNDDTQVVLDNAGSYVNRAIRKIQKRNNYRVMRATVTVVTTLATRNLTTISASFPDIKEFRDRPYILHGDGTTEQIEMFHVLDNVIDRFSWSDSDEVGSPEVLYWDSDDSIKVFPYPDGNSLDGDGEYRVAIPYWKYLPDLTGVETNWFSLNMPEAVEYHAAAMAFYDNFDEGHGDRMTARFEAELAEARKLEKRSQFSETFNLSFGV